MSTLITKRCTRKQVHGPHNWWSRRQKAYYHCFGRETPWRP